MFERSLSIFSMTSLKQHIHITLLFPVLIPIGPACTFFIKVAFCFRSVIVCEDSDQLISLVESQHGVDVKEKVAESERQVELESIRLNEVQPIVRRPQPPQPPRGAPGRRPGQRPGQRRPPQGASGAAGGGGGGGGGSGGIFGALRGRFPFLF